MKKHGLFFILVSLTANASDMGLVVTEVEKLNSLRETMVLSVPNENVDVQTFKAACGPVGVMAKKMAKENNWIFRQASHKNRNLKNATTKLEEKAIRRFKRQRELEAFWLNLNGVDHYFRRITVQKQCLSCHGAKGSRPDFVKKKYPKDKAFGFKVGGLRGLYHVYKK